MALYMKLEKLDKQLKGHIIWYTRSYVEKLEILRIQKGHMIAYVKLQMHDEFVHENQNIFYDGLHDHGMHDLGTSGHCKESDNIINQ